MIRDDGVRVSPLVLAGVVLGAGLGGLLHGILLDPMFPALTWILTVMGVLLLFRAGRRDVVWARRIFYGSMLGGWGLYNLIEGLVGHVILGHAHVHPGPSALVWDWAYVLIGGLGLLTAGFALARSTLAGHVAV